MDRFKITYKRGHGPGGQHKNKVESCVVVTDPVTGFRETCQETRSQAKNRSLAVDRLWERIKEIQKLEAQQRRNELRIRLIGCGMVLRTYNFARSEVKDHRTGKKAPLNKVMNGEINLLK